MAPPVWVPGQVLSASDVNNWLVPNAVVKPSNTSRASTTVLAADPALTINMVAGGLYEVRCMIFYNGALATGYLQWNWSAPSGGGFAYLADYASQGGGADQGYNPGTVAGVEVSLATTVGPVWTGGTSVVKSAYMKGLAIGGAGGALTFNWSQATGASSGTATTVQQNSYIIADRIA